MTESLATWRNVVEEMVGDCKSVAAVNIVAIGCAERMKDYVVLYPDREHSFKSLFANKRAQLAQAPLENAG